MKTFIKATFFFTLFLCCTTVFAQKKTVEVPKNYSFKTAEDYKKYDSLIIEISKWYSKLKMDQWIEKRNAMDKFVLAWAENNPNVKIEIDTNIVFFAENNPHLKAIFVAGWAKYSLTNPLETDPVKGNLAGLKAVCKYYEFDPNLNKDKQIEELIHLNEKSKLRAWVKEKLAINNPPKPKSDGSN